MGDGQCAKRTARILLSALALAVCVTTINSRAESQAPPTPQSSDSLFTTIARLDSAMFDAYNRCDLVKLGSFVTEDLECGSSRTAPGASRL
jgi:hypothetical protein